LNQRERLALILSELEEKKSLSIKDIIKLTNTSRDTVRRDIVKLTNTNMIERTYGGISLPDSFNKLDEYLDRISDSADEKRKLARTASRLIGNSQLVYLDVSTTISLLPQFIKDTPQLLTVTNSLDIADQLIRYANCKARMMGGNLDHEKRCVIGTKPLLELDDYHFDLSFLSVAGIDETGVYYAYEEDIDFKKKIRERSETIVLLVDHSKLNSHHNFHVYNFDEIDIIILTEMIPTELKIAIENAGAKIVYT